ncbi:MAG: peptidoglycan DD-metalloendopeptidase family protein [Eubacteriaceae bacterium]|nr:peptidoglycan DD-metalloendopeptidase family protein [Eubacteriaceae bacterium]
MNGYPKKFRLKLREQSGGRYYERRNVDNVNNSKTQRESPSFRTGFCVMLLVGVMFLKTSGMQGGESFLSKLDSLINSQFDMQKTTQVMAEFFEDAENYFSGNNSGISLSMPVKDAEVTEEFTNSIHPVFMTEVSPVSVTLTGSPSSYVYSALSGRVTSVSDNADGTKRVIIRYNNDVSLAYDNLNTAYVKKDDLIAQENIIGLLKEDDPKLIFEMWVDNSPVDPLEYMKEQAEG